MEKNDKYEVCHFGDKKNLHGFHAELLPQALTEGDCERRVQGQYGVGIQHASSRYEISNIQRSFSPRDSKLKSLDIFIFPSQVEYKKEEGTFLLFEVQMLQLATVVGSALVCFLKTAFIR